jgi:hypothetical protein
MFRLDCRFRTAGCAAAMALSLCCLPQAHAGTLYLTGNNALGATTIQVLDTATGTITNSWPAVDQQELAFAIGSTVRTINRASGVGFGSEYTLDGTFTGTSYQQSLFPVFGFSLLSDGTQDASHNYAIDGFLDVIYSFDRNWANGSFFPWTPPAGADGITFDPANNSLWIADLFGLNIVNFALDGTILGSFSTGTVFPVGLALDPADQTLWSADLLNQGNLVQYAKDGTVLQTVSVPALSDFAAGGMEFAPLATPEPAAIGLAGLGIAALVFLKTRAWSRAGSR